VGKYQDSQDRNEKTDRTNFMVRMKNDTWIPLNELSKQTRISKSELVHLALDRLFADLEKFNGDKV
jgi:hypothetical protein